MSSIGRGQLAANEKAFKYEFNLEILSLKCEIPFPSSLKFMWRRNSKGIQSKQSFEVGSGLVQLSMNEKLSSMSTLIYNTQKRQFLPKESELIINMYFNSSPKKLASTKIDMRIILDPHNYKMPRSETFQVQLKPCVNVAGACKLQYKLSSFFSQELVPSQKSIETGPLNMSGLSIQPQKFFQKKYEVPSKDNYSVNSYNAVGRHPSANKRDESGSIRKLDYGKKYENAAYLTGLKSNISNPQGEFDTRSGFRSIENKTEFGEGNYLNRQLIEEQNKRSRAEAELNKNTVQIGQLKKKMNQMLIQNLKLKEELRNAAALKENASKQQLNALQFKLYQLNNEARQSRNQLELRKREYDAETARLRTQKSTLQAELLTRQKRIEELQRATISAKLTEQIENDNRELKYQVENLRKFIEQINRQNSQQQEKNLREMQELKNVVSVLQLEKEKLLQKQRELATNSREIEEYKSRLTRYENQKSVLQREIIKLQTESENKVGKLNTDYARTNDQLKFYEQKLEQAQRITQKLEEEKMQIEGRSAKLLPQMNELQKRINQSESELSQWKNRSNELQNQINIYKTRIVQLQNQNQRMKNQKEESRMYASSNGEVDRLMRQTLQQQVELKFVKDELSRLQNVEEAYESEKWRADKERSERESLEKENQRIEKQLANKNRALLIELEKTKHMNQELNEALANLSQYKDQLQKNRSIIYAHDQQNLELKETIRVLQIELGRITEENKELRFERQRLLSSGEQLRNLQLKVQELEARDSQKLQIIQNQNRNCMLAQNQIKQLQNRLQYLQYEMGNKQKIANELEMKNRQLERGRASVEAEKTKLLQQLKQEEKKNKMIMEEIHGMKKRYQQEKCRSTSFTRVEEVNRIRDMDAALEKKDKLISKLNKQKLQIEQENIKMNVQVMKLLSELQKIKASSINQSSLKSIGLK